MNVAPDKLDSMNLALKHSTLMNLAPSKQDSVKSALDRIALVKSAPEPITSGNSACFRLHLINRAFLQLDPQNFYWVNEISQSLIESEANSGDCMRRAFNLRSFGSLCD